MPERLHHIKQRNYRPWTLASIAAAQVLHEAMPTSNDLSTSLAPQAFESAEMIMQKPQSTLCVSNFTSAPSLNISTASLADSSSCTLAAQHQYHYIQYPPYYHHISQQTAMPQVPPAAVACHCHCACGAQEQQQQQQQQRALSTSPAACHSQRVSDSMDSQIVVQVHRQAGVGVGGGGGTGGGTEQEPERERDQERPTKAQSEQSLLNHSYQTLQLRAADIHSLAEEKPLNVLRNSRLNISCDCDLECTCGVAMPRAASATPVAHATESAAPAKSKQCHVGVVDAMLGADEITVSESDNNSTMIKKKKCSRDGARSQRKVNSWCHTHDIALGPDKNCDSNYNSSHIDIYSDGENKDSNDISDDNRPPLPPRPPPPRLRHGAGNRSAAHRHRGTGIKKYVVWCLVCGGCSCLLGILFLGVYFLLHSYTITVGNFETVPTFVPAALLILTGLCIMSLARRRNRYSYLIKLSGACGLISALTCALVTVTTTVLHMSRLQALRECEYAQKTRTCTCYSDMIESQVDRVDKEGVRLVFDSLSDCGVVHGSLYSCLRAIFGLSVAGVLIAVFSCMLVYQLLSHERKKMYWEQLELRCRSLYTSQQGPPPNMAALAGARATICRCCEQCHAHRQAPLQATPYPWDDGGEPRFWTGQPPGNFYSPNPGGDDLHATNAASACRGHGVSNTRSRVTGWSWPRMPWQRSSPDPNARQFRQTPSSPDSQYGFTNNAPARGENTALDVESTATHNAHAPFNVAATGLPYGVWGPPPPYSDPNSPARRGYYQYIQPNSCNNSANNNNNNSININNTLNERPTGTFIGSEQHMPPCLNHRSVFLDQPQMQASNGAACCPQTASMRRNSAKRQTTTGGNASTVKSKVGGDYENTPSDSDGGLRDRFSNTLPTRKMKKRIEAGAKASIGGGPNSHPQPAPRLNVQQIFPTSNSNCASENEQASVNGDDYQEQMNSGLSDEANDTAPANCSTSRIPSKPTPRHKRGVENSAFQATAEMGGDRIETTHEMTDPTESEVYFADVSSCCNMSLKNDNYYEDANQVPQQTPQHHHQNSNCSHNSNSSNSEDYLAQRFGQRENSIRSRLPFPQVRTDDDNLNIPMQKGGGGVTTTALPPNQMQKEMSRQSMCSVESEAKTEFTDLSPATPCSNQFAQTTFDGKQSNDELTDVAAQRSMSNFVATFPYSESQSLEAHRRSTKDAHELMLTPEAHYEVINDNPPSQFAIGSANLRANKSQQHPQPQPQPQQQQRPNNLLGSKRLHELTTQVQVQTYKQKHTSKSRERLNAPAAYQTELEWAGGNNSAGAGAGGGGGGDRQCL